MHRRSRVVLPLTLLGVVLASCDDQRPPTAPQLDLPVSTAIVDAPRGGNSNFFWLPPMVPNVPTFTGPFDGNQLDRLAVEICQLDATGNCVAGPPLARFTSKTQPKLIVDRFKQFYSVGWLTTGTNATLFYRARVLLDGAELGLIDVDVVRNTIELNDVDRTQYVGVLRGKTLAIRFRLQRPTAATNVKINEVESSGGVPGDWIELHNMAPTALSIGGYVVRDNDDTHTYTIPAGTTIPAGGFHVIEEADLGFGLGGGDAVRFFAPDGTTLHDSFVWTAHAPTTYGRCPDGTGAFKATTTVTKGAANDCTVVVMINEVESSGGVPGDWTEIFNPSPNDADISGWVFKDNDDTHVHTLPAGTIVPAGGYFVIEEAAQGFGLGSADEARLFRPDGSIADSYSWTAHASTTYGRCPNGTGPFVTTAASTKGAANSCAAAGTTVHINEIESSGGSPGDWVELYNAGPNAADLSGWSIRDNDDTHVYLIPAGTSVAPNAFLVVDETSLGFGLGSADEVRLFDPSGVLFESHPWSAHATTTYGRCPDGTGAFVETTSSTKGTANACTGQITFDPWPGSSDFQIADDLNVFGGNLSGLTHEASGSAAPGVLWAVRNGPGSLFRLVWNGSIYTPDATNGWSAGKTLAYPGGTGSPDSEGVTFADGGSAGGMYVATERDNNNNSVSRNSILRFDVSGSSTTLTATHEWNLTSDLPPNTANTGIEAITWIPDTYLLSKGFFDESKGQAYDPTNYANHGTGLFFIGVEATGTIYAYALDHVGGGFTKIATIASGFPGVMALEFDPDLGDLWAVCDDGCLGRSTVLQIDASGKFAQTFHFERPALMPNLNNEGFAIGSALECVGGFRPVYWADDAETGGHSIRRGSVQCVPF